MRFTQLQIEKFRGIELLDVKLHQKLNVFAGINGVGKTTILEALAFFFQLYPGYGKGNSHDSIDFEAEDFQDSATGLRITINCDLSDKAIFISEFHRPVLPEFGAVARRMTQISAPPVISQWFVENALGDNENARRLPILAYYASNRDAKGTYNSNSRLNLS
jgi:hypothetical protein